MLAFFLSHGAEEDGMNMGWASAHPRAGEGGSDRDKKRGRGRDLEITKAEVSEAKTRVRKYSAPLAKYICTKIGRVVKYDDKMVIIQLSTRTNKNLGTP